MCIAVEPMASLLHVLNVYCYRSNDLFHVSDGPIAIRAMTSLFHVLHVSIDVGTLVPLFCFLMSLLLLKQMASLFHVPDGSIAIGAMVSLFHVFHVTIAVGTTFPL